MRLRRGAGAETLFRPVDLPIPPACRCFGELLSNAGGSDGNSRRHRILGSSRVGAWRKRRTKEQEGQERHAFVQLVKIPTSCQPLQNASEAAKACCRFAAELKTVENAREKLQKKAVTCCRQDVRRNAGVVGSKYRADHFSGCVETRGLMSSRMSQRLMAQLATQLATGKA